MCQRERNEKGIQNSQIGGGGIKPTNSFCNDYHKSIKEVKSENLVIVTLM